MIDGPYNTTTFWLVNQLPECLRERTVTVPNNDVVGDPVDP